MRRSLALAALLGAAALLPAGAQEVPFLEEVVPPPELGRGAQIDIARMTWRVAGSDGAAMAGPSFDDSGWVAQAGVSQEVLRNPVAWYRFTFLLAPGAEGLGSRLELGGIEGNAAVYLNGTLIGEIRGATVPPYERREMFTLPAVLLLPEKNVLALRLTGLAGRAKVGIPRGPIRLFPLSRAYEREDRATQALREADQTAARLGGMTPRLEDMGLQAQLARILLATGGQQQGVDAALAAMDAARRATAQVVAGFAPRATASPAFGRFGRGHVEGLLTATLWPTGFQSATTSLDPAPVAGVFGAPGRGDHSAVEAIAPEGKIVRVTQASGARYRLYYPLMYPGFAIEPLEATLSVRFDRPLEVLWVDRWGVATASAATRALLPWTEPWLVLHDPGSARPPILVALSSPVLPIRLANAPESFAVELPARQIARFCWPAGIGPWPGHVDRPAMARFRAWADAMVPFGRSAEEVARGDRLAVRERFAYLPTGAIPYAPLPPAYGALMTGTGWIRAPKAKDLGVPTLAGPLWADRKAHEIAYELPLPDIAYRVRARIDGTPAVPLGALPDPQGDNAMALAYTRRADAFSRWIQLSKKDRQALEANTAAQLPRAWGPLSWAESIEPLTGTPYRWTLGQLGPEGRVRAISRPNGLAIYGTSVAAACTGDWSVPAGQWPRVRRAFDWFLAAFDWAWQAPVDSDAGLEGADDRSLEGAYLGSVGMARLARAISPGDEDPALAYAARIAPLRAGRQALSRYLSNAGLLPPASTWAGFTEGGAAYATASAVAETPSAEKAATASAGAMPDAPPLSLLEWAPARLEDFVWKPKVRTLEARFALKQATERFRVRLECPRPTDAQANGQPADIDYDGRTGVLTFAPGSAAGAQTLVLKL